MRALETNGVMGVSEDQGNLVGLQSLKFLCLIFLRALAVGCVGMSWARLTIQYSFPLGHYIFSYELVCDIHVIKY